MGWVGGGGRGKGALCIMFVCVGGQGGLRVEGGWSVVLPSDGRGGAMFGGAGG